MRFFLLTIILLIFFVPISWAQSTSVGVANSVVIEGNPQEGSIVSSINQTYVLSAKGEDTAMVGVVTKNPALDFRLRDNSNQTPILSQGRTLVLVSILNGAIRNGDFITSSTKPGVGMKATNSGYVLGRALESYNGKTNEVGKIYVDINIHYHTPNNSLMSKFLDLANIPGLVTYQDSVIFLKYGAAGLVVVLSFFMGFILFGKVCVTQIEAMGRNPLATNAIRISFVINVVLIICVCVAGIVLGFFIIKL